jgi:hypothetical protein
MAMYAEKMVHAISKKKADFIANVKMGRLVKIVDRIRA